MTDISLHFAPDTCSRVPMVALEETGHPYRMELVTFMTGHHRSPEFLALNPSGRVPVLVVDGRPLSENVAILLWLDRTFPDANLLPRTDDAFAQATITADLTFCAANLHPLVTRLRFPQFFCDRPESLPRVFALAEETMGRLLQPVEDRLKASTWWYGDSWSIQDAYINWVWFRISGTAFDTSRFRHLQRHNEAMLARPAVQRVLAVHRRAAEELSAQGLAVPLGTGDLGIPGFGKS